MPEEFAQEPGELAQPSSYTNEVCPHCHEKRVLEKGLLHCKRCNNADIPISVTAA